MKTVKEISDLTGISVRTIHYYDEIHLLKPTDKSEAGYRLYDDKALEKLQQILFFREFELPLKEIKAVMDNPALDRNQILRMQRTMLSAKKEHMERLIANIDDILKGDNDMDFEVFHKDDIESLFQSLMEDMPEEQRENYINVFLETSTNLSEEEKRHFRENGESMEEFHKLFLKNASSEQAQKNFQKVVEWYGDKESALEAGKNPQNSQIFQAYQNRLDAVMKKLAEKREKDVSSFEVKELIGEYDFVSKQLYQMKSVKEMMLDMAGLYQSNEAAKTALDRQYGEGTADFFAKAIQEFYK